MELEQSKGDGDRAGAGHFLDSAVQARAELTFCLFFDEARDIDHPAVSWDSKRPI